MSKFLLISNRVSVRNLLLQTFYEKIFKNFKNYIFILLTAEQIELAFVIFCYASLY